VKAVVSTLLLAFFLSSCSGNGDESKKSATATQATAEPSSPAANVESSSSNANYVLPPKDTKSLILSVSATRTPEGAIVISGQTLLPPGTKVWIERRTKSGNKDAEADTFIDELGKFSSQPFSDNGRALKEGANKIGLVSYFNGIWQEKTVLSITGKGGINLPSAALEPDDPEFPKAGGHIDQVHTVFFPAIPADVVAIDRVKSSKLYAQGLGQAVDTVEQIVAFYGKTSGFKTWGWSAEKSAANWIVTLDYEDGTARRKAQWEFNPTSGKVRYLDPLSKIFSWLPAE
jgi:hypothetical protein